MANNTSSPIALQKVYVVEAANGAEKEASPDDGECGSNPGFDC